MTTLSKIFIILILLNLMVGCTNRKIYERESIVESPFRRMIGPRDEAILRYGFKGIEERIIAETPIISPSEVSPGERIRQELRYGLLSQSEEERFIVSESVTILIGNESLELLRQQSEKEQGIHLSAVHVTIPKDINPGQYQIITTLSIPGDVGRILTATFTVR